MADVLIVNKYGVLHVVPESLLSTVERQGGRRATEQEQMEYVSSGGNTVAPAPVQPTDKPAAPWADYDSMNAEQVAARLRVLPPDRVQWVLAYEAAHKDRKTITAAAAAILKSEE